MLRIEHLKLDDLQLLPKAIFGKLKPYVVFVTTPNSEFNVCFGSEKTEEDGKDAKTTFRHWDHKFEWSRNEFAAWFDYFSFILS
jgi:hypothetical protein